MDELKNVLWYEDYIDNVLNEKLSGAERDDINAAFAKMKTIDMGDGNTVSAQEIIKVVTDACEWLDKDFSRTYVFAQHTLNIIYLAHSSQIPTMAVDEGMNLYLNAEFVYKDLKMNYKYVGTVIMHEVYHALYNHIQRSENWLAANGKAKTQENWDDTNLAADIEVNQSLVRSGVTDENIISNEIHGLYLRNAAGELGENTNVVTMETILENERYMAKLRKMANKIKLGRRKGRKQDIKTSGSFDDGYKEAWNKLAGLIKKYGYQDVWKKLNDAGICNSLGEVFTGLDTDVLDNLEESKMMGFVSLKSFEDFLNESVQASQGFETYEDGFWAATSKIVSSLYQAMYGKDDPDADKEDEGDSDDDTIDEVNVDTKLKDEDLEDIDLPLPKKKGQKTKGDQKLPNKIRNTRPQNQKDQKNDDKKNKSNGQGGFKNDLDNASEEDKHQLEDDIEQSGGFSSTQEIDTSGLGTGGFLNGNIDHRSILEDAGYEQKEIDELSKAIERNQERNTPARIQKEIDDVKRELKSTDYIKRMLDKIEVDSAKYKNMWKEILEQFMSQKTRRAGVDVATGRNDWKRKNSIGRGEYGINRKKVSQDPQDVNLCVDVSGSMDNQLLEIIARSIVIFTQEWQYSGLNVSPWASTFEGIHRIDEFYSKSEDEISNEILKAIEEGQAQCGGGTEARAAIGSIAQAIKASLEDPDKEEKDDVHIVITDGQFSCNNIEARIKQVVGQITGSPDVAERAPENTIWMIYDADDSIKEKWNREIKIGKIIYIVSKVVKNNA